MKDKEIDTYLHFRRLSGYEIIERYPRNYEEIRVQSSFVLEYKHKVIGRYDSRYMCMTEAVRHHRENRLADIEIHKQNVISKIDGEIKAYEDSLLVISLKIAELKERRKRVQEIHSLTGRIVPLEECALSVRTMNCCQNAGFVYLEDVYLYMKEHGETGLLKLKNFGRKSLRETREILEHHGLI